MGQVLKTVGQISIPGPMGYPRGSYSNYLMHVPGLNLASAIARPGLVALVPFLALPGGRTGYLKSLCLNRDKSSLDNRKLVM